MTDVFEDIDLDGVNEADSAVLDPETEFFTTGLLLDRKVLFIPTETGKAASNNQIDPVTGRKALYTFVMTDVVVFSGPTTDRITKLPHLVRGMRVSDTMVANRIEGAVARKAVVGGIIDGRPSTKNKQITVYGLQPFQTEADKILARKAKVWYHREIAKDAAPVVDEFEI